MPSSIPDSALQPDPLLPQYRWNPAARNGQGAYIDARGRFVSDKTIRDGLDEYIAAKEKAAAALADKLANGSISLADFELGMMQNIKDAHLASAALAKGGWFHMTQADFGRVGQIVRREYGYFREFAKQIRDKVATAVGGNIKRRVRQYMNQARLTYYDVKRASARLLGNKEIRSTLNPADHCGECVAFDGRWFPINSDEYKPPGRRECRSNCKCYEEYR